MSSSRYLSLEPPDIARVQLDDTQWRTPLFKSHKVVSLDILKVFGIVVAALQSPDWTRVAPRVVGGHTHW